MKLISINVGLPRELTWRGKTVTTGIVKEPVAGPVALRRHNLEGDGQANLKAHGGKEKAVYAYAHEHYAYWATKLPGVPLPFGVFGENLTVEGADEAGVFVGDRYGVGTAKVVVTVPRLPCHKLALHFRRDDIERRFTASGRCGFYLSVAGEGELEAGNQLTLLARPERTISIAELFAMRVASDVDPEHLLRAAAMEVLSDGWREHFRERLRSG